MSLEVVNIMGRSVKNSKPTDILCKLGLTLMISLWSQVGFTDQAWMADKDYEVFESATTNSDRLGVLHKGQSAIMVNLVKPWSEIIVKVKGEKIHAYINTPEEKQTDPVQEKELEKAADSRDFGIGVLAAYSNYYQSARTFIDTDGSATDIGTLSGKMPYFGFFADWDAFWRWSLRVGFLLRKLDLQGTAQYKANVPTAPTQVDISQDFTSFFTELRYLVLPSWKFWIAPGFEIAPATRSIVFNTAAEKPTYFILSGSTGVNFDLGLFYFTPEIKLGAIINSKPLIYNGEAILGVGLKF